MVILEYFRVQNSVYPLHGWVFVGARLEDVLVLAVCELCDAGDVLPLACVVVPLCALVIVAFECVDVVVRRRVPLMMVYDSVDSGDCEPWEWVVLVVDELVTLVVEVELLGAMMDILLNQ